MDVDLRFVRINDMFARINGHPKSAHIGRTLREMLPEMADRLEPLYRRVIETGEAALNMQIVGRTRADPHHDRVRMSSCHPLTTPEGEVWGVDTVVQEITSLKQAERAQRESEEHLRTVINHAPAVLWAIDAEGRFTLSEGRALKALGLRPGEVVGRALFDLYADIPQVIGYARRALAGETVKALTAVHDQIFETRHAPRVDEDGKVVGAFGVAINVTERERAAEERRRLESQIQEAQRLESLGLLAGGIAHDFHNLLMGVLGNADLALARIPAGTPGREFVRQIETTAQRAAELRNQMLAYSGKGRFVVEPLDLNRIVEEMGDLLRTVISKRAVLRLDLAPDLPAVEADASQVRQVVMNLITNASEAHESRSGTIVVHTGSLWLDQRQLRGYALDTDLCDGTYVMLRVSDTGVGMDAGTQRRIFDPFFSTKFTGRGLGLAGVLGIVRGHRRAIRVRSQPGGGSSFEVLLPASDRAIPAASVELPSEQALAATETVLLVDDDEMVAGVAQAMLEAAGFTVLVARDGQEGVGL